MLLRSVMRWLLLAAVTSLPLQPAQAAPAAAPRAEAAAPQAIAPAPTACSPSTASLAAGGSLPIPAAGVVTSTLSVSGQGPYLWDVNLTTNLAHSDSDDLDVWLTSPAGTTATITTDNGNNRQNVFNGTVWDDQAGSPVSDRFFVADAVVPALVAEEAMGAFISENPNGVWTLTVEDDSANGSTGQLNGWSLELTTLPTAPHSSLVSFVAGTDVAIPDSGTLVRTLTVTGAPAALGELRLVTEIDHPRNNDLDVELVSPTGITVTVTTDNGGTLASGFLHTEWYDRAGLISPPGPVSESTFTNGVSKSPMVVEEALSAYNGLDPNGTWKLIITDDLPINVGTLESWALHVRGFDCLADLEVTDSLAPGYSALASVVPFSLSIGNAGAGPASEAAFDFELLAGGTLAQVPSPNGWQCSAPAGSNTQFHCSRATLVNGLTSGFQVLVQTAAVPHLVEAVITATSTSAESNLVNNTLTLSTFAGLFSANGNPWEVRDTNLGGDDGALLDGGQDAFDTWGALRLRVSDQAANILTNDALVSGYGLHYVGNRRWASQAMPVYSGVAVSRQIWAPAQANWVRYVDTFVNTANAGRNVDVAWGGNLGSDSTTTVAGTSTGDMTIESSDAWVLTIESSGFNPNGPASDAPVGYAVGSASVDLYAGATDWAFGPFTTVWSGNGSDGLAHHLELYLPPNQTAALAYFVYRGLAEGAPGPEGCTSGCVNPAAGSQIALAQSTLIALEANPPLCDLPAGLRAVISNWPEAVSQCQQTFVPWVVR